MHQLCHTLVKINLLHTLYIILEAVIYPYNSNNVIITFCTVFRSEWFGKSDFRKSQT